MDWMELGYIGLFIVSFLAATILPLSSDAILFAMLWGEFDPLTLLLVATIGNWLGGITTYYLGVWCSTEWLTRWMSVSPENLQKKVEWVKKYGVGIALLSWVPIIGDVLVIALGMVRASAQWTIFFLLVGKMARYSVVIGLQSLI